MKVLRVGTRGSALAMAQAKAVAAQLEQAVAGVHVELITITTAGDRRSEGERTPSGGLKALFTKEIEEALFDGRIDLAIHSLKDMAAELPRGLYLGATPKREDPRDAWVSKTKTPFRDVPPQSQIGTGAVRRQAQLRLNRADLVSVPLRGNVDTRLRKLRDPDEGLDGILLAAAGLRRLGLEHEITEILSTDLFLPAVGQGCLAIEAREGDHSVEPYLQAIDDAATRTAVMAERAFLQGLGGSCQTPIAAYATMDGDTVSLSGLVVSPDGRLQIRDRRSGPARDAEALGQASARRLLDLGASHLLD